MLKNPTAALLLATALLLGAGVPASPALASVPDSVTVHYGDLDLARTGDAARLYARIVEAARLVCAPDNVRVLLQIAGSRACVRATVDAAVAQVALPPLTAYHLAKLGHG